MKKCYLFTTLCCFIMSAVLAQSDNEKKAVTEKVQLMENSFKENNPGLMAPLVSAEAEPHFIEKITQMQQQMPKGSFKITAITVKDDSYSANIMLMPFSFPMAIVLDKKFLYKKILIGDEAGKADDAENDTTVYNIPSPHLSLPFQLKEGFILIEATVNGKKGTFMLDTGTPFGFFLNNHFLGLEKGTVISRGKAESGQDIVLYQASGINITLPQAVQLTNLENVFHADFSFIEQGVATDFIGFIGYDFLKDYEMVIDYNKKVVDLYKLDKNGKRLANYSLSNTEIATINFTTGSEKQLPLVDVKLGTETIKAYLDTGTQGSIQLTETTKSKLVKAKAIALPSKRKGNEEICTVNNLSIQNVPDVKMKDIPLITAEKDEIALGYEFLKNYISIWNFKDKTIKLLKP